MRRASRTHLVLAAVAVLAAGCAAPARVEQMQIDAPMAVRAGAESSPLRGKVSVQEVTGGKDTNPAWVSNIASADFERALEASLKSAGLLADNRQASKFRLIAHMLKLDQPLMGASMTVTASVQYTLIDHATGRQVFARTLSTPYTAAWNAAFMGSERLQLANEGAAKANIQVLLDALLALKASDLELTSR